MSTAQIKLVLAAGLFAAGVSAAAPLPDALLAGWKGKPACKLLREDPGHRLLRCTFLPGEGHERHFHPAHIGYALQGGTMRITDSKGTRDQMLEAGSSYTSSGTQWHEVVNIGTTPVVYLIFEETGAVSAPH